MRFGIHLGAVLGRFLGPKMGSKSSNNRLFGIPEGHQNFDVFQEAKKVDKKWVEGHWLGGE